MSDADVSRETPPPPPEAAEVFSDRLPLVCEYAERLVGAGVARGLIGPRESTRIWSRHLLNCAVVADAAVQGSRVADVGSGAGLPGLAWAIRRPDLSVTLVEPLLRRTRFLEETIAALGLADRVSVVRARAEEMESGNVFDVVTSRALAPLQRLVGWCAPLCRPGGRIVAMKGRSAADEIGATEQFIGRVSDRPASVETYGGQMLPESATTVEIVVDRPHGVAR